MRPGRSRAFFPAGGGLSSPAIQGWEKMTAADETILTRLGNRILALEDEMTGEKAVTRHVLRQASLNADDLATLKTEVRHLTEQMVLANAALNSHGVRLNVLTQDTAMIRQEITALRTDVGAVQEQVSTLQQQVSTLQQQVSTLQQETRGIRQEITTLRTDLGAVQEQVSTLQQQVSTLQQETREVRQEIRGMRDDIAAIREAVTPRLT
jgi:chromosome segregation ATPase